MKKLSVDLETFSTTDLTKSGVYKYVEDPSFEVLLFGVSVDDGPVTVYDLKSGETLPEEIIAALTDNSVSKWAFNAMFERVCLSRYLWDMGKLKRGTYLDPKGWRCDMIWSGYMGFPMSLEKAGAALQLGEQKLKEGKDLIRLFSIPCKPTASNGGRTRNLPQHEPEKWETFKAYNKRDVEVEMEIQRKLSAHPVPESVWQEYWMDQTINDRGIYVDMQMVRSAIRLDSISQEHLTKALQELTNVDNPSSILQMKEWLASQGMEMDSLGKKFVAEALKTAPEPLRTVLTLRQQLAMSAVKKYTAMETAACADGRCRGMFQFYGANRSGRFCLAEGTPVLVKDEDGIVYEKPIEEVLVSDMVFDGNEWVHHEGVVFSGDKEVITWDGITATPEHTVFISETEKLPLGEAMEKGLRIWRGRHENL